ncbi:hypothetical protein BHF71_08460 [Vulcanibacillus modesticaldus]|uniref:Glycosyl transferase family 1 domain-containing protein n=1 Tax=Vulcanibacillus modesticaldus TaxID=337097 RepID=A0A1D2YV43_9BACI|nr:glycosyltransferase [Vulcanibacillus modesticaldus]OEF99570.1 hypothetical protein BHF71_08460 [Vulcanibacillus modesticaldus]
MKVALVTPFFHQQRGNTVTVKRIASGLSHLGVSPKIYSLTNENTYPSIENVDLVHGFNAFYFYRFWRRKGINRSPYIVTLTGTDLNHALFDEDKRSYIIYSLEKAKAIHVFNQEARKVLVQEVPSVTNKIFVIPQGVTFFSNIYNEKFQKEKDTCLFLLPAGIRKVKNISSAITMLGKLHDSYPNIRLWLVGPIIEDDEGKKIFNLVDKNSHWIRYLGQIDHEKMGEVYSQADIVLNTSLSEGQSSALLEAMSFGIPVIAANNLGNRSIVFQGKNGYIYNNESDFIKYALKLMKHCRMRQMLGETGKRFVLDNHSASTEAVRLLSIYNQVLQTNS